MNKNFITLISIVILIVIAYFFRNYWMPYFVASPQVSCVTITTPTPGTTLHFPLTIAGTVQYGCWTIFEAVAGHAFIRQNGQNISDANADNGRLTVNGDYYQASDYPVGIGTTIQNIDGNYTGAAEIVINPERPCGDTPDCPPAPAPIIIPVNLP